MLAHRELMHSDLQRKVMPLFRHHRHTGVSRKDRQSGLCCISWPVRPQSSACRSCIKRFAPHVITTLNFVVTVLALETRRLGIVTPDLGGWMLATIGLRESSQM